MKIAWGDDCSIPSGARPAFRMVRRGPLTHSRIWIADATCVRKDMANTHATIIQGGLVAVSIHLLRRNTVFSTSPCWDYTSAIREVHRSINAIHRSITRNDPRCETGCHSQGDWTGSARENSSEVVLCGRPYPKQQRGKPAHPHRHSTCGSATVHRTLALRPPAQHSSPQAGHDNMDHCGSRGSTVTFPSSI